MIISKHISYNEAIKSQTAIRHGIDNNPGRSEIIRMRTIAEFVFEPIREYFNRPIYISSFYRCHELNRLLGSTSKSQHVKGEAMDIDCDSINGLIFDYIKDNLKFDQLIWEFGDETNPDWVHVSFTNNRVNRMRVLRAIRENGLTRYIKL